MQLKELYTNFLNELKLLYEPNEASVITTMIFESLAAAGKSDTITHPHRIVEKEIQQKIEQALTQLKEYQPVQYVIGQAWFYNLPFIVSPAVLVPRPETEELVSAVIAFIKSRQLKTLLDIGTGSGCIPISIKKNLPQVLVSALDISEDALAIAKENAATLSSEITFIQMDFLDEKSWKELPVYDAIVSNPPYIPENEKEKLDKNVAAHEPHIALFVPDDQRLIFYKKIAAFGKNHLPPGGCIFLETHESYANEVADHFTEQGYETIVKKDFYEKERMVIATRRR